MDLSSTEQVPVTSTTTETFVPFYPTRPPFKGYEFPVDLSSFSVPLAITIVVCMVLCIVVFYTKARRRRHRLASGPRNNLRSISGGVPTNVSAYRNYGVHLGGRQAPHGLSPTFMPEEPPPYEIAITTPSAGAYAAPLQSYPNIGRPVIAPPPYMEAVTYDPPASLPSSSTINETPDQPRTDIYTSVPPPQSSTPSTTDTSNTTPDTLLEESHSNNTPKKKSDEESEGSGPSVAESVPKPDTSDESPGVSDNVNSGNVNTDSRPYPRAESGAEVQAESDEVTGINL